MRLERIATDLETLFNSQFRAGFNTVLEGGADEPLYLPSAKHAQPHRLIYREDFFSSALHEISHWCIAGRQRRSQVDFGYWYEPDGRTPQQQAAFERVEVKPQALEWIFSNAAGIAFNVSADNLSAAERSSDRFVRAVEDQASCYCRSGVPERAGRFIRALRDYYGTPECLDSRLYRGRLLP